MTERTFHVPLLPVSKNPWQRMFWAKRNSIKQTWERCVWGYANQHPRMPRNLPCVRCSIVVLWDKRGPLPDWHNLEMAHEVIADGLVKAGVIADDSEGQYIREDLTIRRPEPGEKPGTYVTIRWEAPHE